MPKRPHTLETVEIYIEILRRIPRNQKITVSELHEQLIQAGYDRSRRSIERNLNELCNQYGIECDDRSKPYGYRWKNGAKGSMLPILSQQESLLLALAEEYLRNILPKSLMKSMDSLFKQAQYDLNTNEESTKNREWLDKVRVIRETIPLIAAPIDQDVFEAVSDALYNNKILNLEYENAKGKISKSDVMPLGLAQQAPNLYLVCRFDGFTEERTLALHRIHTAKVSNLGFDRPPEFDLEKYDADGRFGFGNGKRIKLTFQMTKVAGFHLRSTKISTDQTIKEIDDKLEITATVVESNQLRRWLLGFGDQLSVISKIEI